MMQINLFFSTYFYLGGEIWMTKVGSSRTCHGETTLAQNHIIAKLTQPTKKQTDHGEAICSLLLFIKFIMGGLISDYHWFPLRSQL